MVAESTPVAVQALPEPHPWVMAEETARSRFIPPWWAQLLIFAGVLIASTLAALPVMVIPVPHRWVGVQELVSFAGMIAVVLVVAVAILHRSWRSLGLPRTGLARGYLCGAGVGAAQVAVVFGILAATGHITSWKLLPATWLIAAIGIGFIIQSFAEELLVRGWLMPWLAVRTNQAWAIAITSALFGALHALNANVTALSVLNIVLAGLFSGLATILTGTLWFAAGAHFSWNYLLACAVGDEVSGAVMPALGSTTMSGPVLWTGGSFGFEGSVGATIAWGASVVVLALLLRARGRRTPHLAESGPG